MKLFEIKTRRYHGQYSLSEKKVRVVKLFGLPIFFWTLKGDKA